jgi:hypothetical protein
MSVGCGTVETATVLLCFCDCDFADVSVFVFYVTANKGYYFPRQHQFVECFRKNAKIDY